MSLMNALPDILGTRARLLLQPSVVKVLPEGNVQQCMRASTTREREGEKEEENLVKMVRANLQQPTIKK